MRNLLVTIRYRGTNYHGFQVQKNAVSVCQVFQDAQEKVFGGRLDIKGCSRTDAGVHANEFCLNFWTDRAIPCHKVPLALNAHLPEDVAVTACREVPLDFHARYDCCGKEYCYLVHNSPVRDPFLEGLAWRYPRRLDDQALDHVAKAFLGTHDFSAFCSTGSTVEDPVRTLYSFQVRRQGDLVRFVVRGDGFLYNMVRILVGTLVQASEKGYTPEMLGEILSSKERSRAGRTAPPWGLYLNRVFYSRQELLDVEP